METTVNMDGTEKDILRLVLEEILEEQKGINEANGVLLNSINEVLVTVRKMDEKLEQAGKARSTVDAASLERIISKGTRDMYSVVANLSRQNVRQFRILLFPEKDAELYYKIVFGRWFLLLVISLFLTIAYQWALHWSDNRREVELRSLENNKIVKAWNYLYQQKGKDLRRRMDSALIQSQSFSR